MVDKVILLPTTQREQESISQKDSAYLDRLKEVCDMIESISNEFESGLKDTLADTIYLAVGRDIVRTLG